MSFEKLAFRSGMNPDTSWRLNRGTQLAEALQESRSHGGLIDAELLHSPNLNHEWALPCGNEGYKGRIPRSLLRLLEQRPKEDVPWILHKFHIIHYQDQEQDEEGLRSISQALQEAESGIDECIFMIPHEAFLSHSSLDQDFFTSLADGLRRHRVPVWYSRTNIMGAQQWHDEIGAALRDVTGFFWCYLQMR